MKVQPNTLRVDNVVRLHGYYQDHANPELTEYVVNLNEEAPKLAGLVSALDDEERKEFEKAVDQAVKRLNPTLRNQMAIGGLAGGALGGGVALTALSVRQISQLFNNPILFAAGVTAMGVVAGALTPAALDHFKDVKGNSEVESPMWWNVILPKFNMKINFASASKPEAKGE